MPTPDEADQLRGLIREAHEAAQAVNDAIARYNRMMEVHDQVTAAWMAERVDRVANEEMTRFQEAMEEGIRTSVAAIYDRFDLLFKRLVGDTKRARRTGQSLTAITEELEAHPEAREIWDEAVREISQPGLVFFKKQDGEN